jgi:rhodanese-related sulfurtransferase
MPLAHAQLVPGNKPPTALEGIPAAGSRCDGDKGESTTGTAKSTTLREYPTGNVANFGCAIDADRLQSMLPSPDIMLADLRAPSAFAVFHIFPAVNVSPSVLANRSYWRNKRLVLIGDGKGEHELYVQCARLKRQGYAGVYVLRGGIAQWHAHGLPLYGRAPALATQIRLSATELWQETHNPRNLVLLDASLSSLVKTLPATRAIPASTPDAIVGALGARDRRNASATAIILVTAAQFDDDRIVELSQAVRPIPLLIHSGSADEYHKQLALQQAVWKTHEQGPRTPRCGN